MKMVIEALDVLGVALASHKHHWPNRERHLYERAITSLIRRDSGSSASKRRLDRMPLPARLPASGQGGGQEHALVCSASPQP